MAVVRAVEVTKQFGTRRVLDRASFTLDGGEARLIRGRSGSGKSTLLHILAGIEQPTSGHVEVDGQALRGLDASALGELRLRSVGYVFQHFNLLPDLTAEENVRLPMTLAKRRGRRARALDLLAQVGLQDHAKSFPGSLSGGEMQRVAIARALANEPRLILADEPTANLDENNARLVLSLLRGIASEGRAVLVASHDPLARESFTDQVELRDGRLERGAAGPAPSEH